MAITVAALSLSRQGLSERYVERAQDALADDPARALVEADRALRLDRESIDAYYAKAAALARFGEGDAARAVLLDATRREPQNFVTWALLGDLSVRRGELREAQAEYRRAARLNPRDPGLAKLAVRPAAAMSSGRHRAAPCSRPRPVILEPDDATTPSQRRASATAKISSIVWDQS